MPDSDPDPVAQIVVTENGPYRVTGIPLIRAVQVETEFGEPIDWAYGPSWEVGETYDLCRCGQSKNKPFCDKSHRRVGFEGFETADRGPSAARRKSISGVDLVLTDDTSLCAGAGYCGDRFIKVWQLMERTGDPAVRERVKRMVSMCPSGRLQYLVPPSAEPVELAYEPSIGVRPNGPYVLRGRIRVVSEDGTLWEVRNRVTLCRCGRSSNKPFCDESHEEVAFSDPAVPPGVTV